MPNGPIPGGAGAPGFLTWEAEDAMLDGGAAVARNWDGFDGEGFVDFQASRGESVTWAFDVGQTGIYAIGFRYALSDSPRSLDGRPLTLLVNGVETEILPFLPTGDRFTDWQTLWTEVLLPAGTVTLSLATTGSGGANLDQVSIGGAPIQVLNSAPSISGTVADATLTAGGSVALAAAGLSFTDADLADQPHGALTLADGSPLPSFLRFDPATLTIVATAAAPPGQYDLLLRATDGQAESAAAIAFAVQVRAAPTISRDLDGDGIANGRDPDDDNDGLLDIVDPFLADASNGRGVRIDAGSVFVLDFTQVPTGAPAGWGFGLTGLMVNGVASPGALGLGSPALSFVDGALHIENAGIGGPGTNTQLYGAQFGVDPNARMLTISVTIDNPYDTRSAALGQSFGLYLGTGDQSDYLRLSLRDGLSLRIDGERDGIGWGAASYAANQAALAQAGDLIHLTFDIDTLTGVVRSSWSIDTATGTITGEGAAVTLTGDLLAAVRGDATTAGVPTGLAIGIDASSGLGDPLDVDVLDFRVEGHDAPPDILVTGLDAAFMPDRLVFNYIEDPVQNKNNPGREYKDAATVRITNTGASELHLSQLDLDGPFKFLDSSDLAVKTLAVGASLDVEIGFDRAAFTPPERGLTEQFGGTFKVFSDDPDEAVQTVDLAGYWQTVPEAGREPPLNTIFETFGFANRVDEEILGNGRYEKAAPEEVLAPYWKIAAGYTQVTAIQLAAFKDIGQTTLSIHAPGDYGDLKKIFSTDKLYNQSFLPILEDGGPLVRSFGNDKVPDIWDGSDWFGFRLSGTSSDPTLNKPPLKGEIRGYDVRFFHALDGDGNEMADTYLLACDFHGSNLDFNDTVYLITGITPVTELLLV